MGAKFNNHTTFKKLSSSVLNFDIDNIDTNDNATYPCPACDKIFNAKLGRTQHQRQTQDCNIIYTRQILFKKCPTIGCNTLWTTGNDLENT